MVFTYLISVILGVLGSLVASIVFLFFISRMRPKLEISKTIAKSKDPLDVTMYSIKVVNRSRRSIVNIKVQLQLIQPTSAPGGMVEGAFDVQLAGADPLELSGFSKKENEEKCSYRFSTYEDLDKYWADDKHTYLRFRIFATDSLSGFGKVFTQEYQLKRIALKEGDFVKGPELTIV